MTSAIRTLCAAGLLLGASTLVSSNAASAQGKGHKDHKVEQKVDQKVAKSVYKNDKVVRKTNQTVARRYSTTRRILCDDGVWGRWTSSCVGHGGVAARQVTYKGPTPRASARARARASTNSAVYRSTYANTNPTGAIARCNDGTYWHSTSRTSACYGHGGVARWL